MGQGYSQFTILLASLLGLVLSGRSPAGESLAGVEARVRPATFHVPLGQPVWVTFSLENTTDRAIPVTVPGSSPDLPPPEVGLPLSHVFSGGGSSGVTVFTDTGRRWEMPVGYRAPGEAPLIVLGPQSMVGTRLDLREYYPSLRSAGQFKIHWKPYRGALSSETVTIHVAPLKQVEITTDEGVMTLRLLYDEAPETVANFLELARSGFYSGKTFHRVEPGYMIQGGCPRGDGTGIRMDGKRVPAEFNNRPHEKGSVAMALLDDDPDSASCQFFICNTRQKEWDGKYTVFAQLYGEASFATLDRLMSVPVDEYSRPVKTLYMRSVKVTDAPVETPSDAHTSR